MSRREPQQYPTYPVGHPDHGRPLIVPNQHDVLCGRGVNIAQHAGNERFRALVNARHDADYCHSYTTSEKRAVAEDIINHLKKLNPPGRFLKRPGRSKNSRGLEGPWEELSEKEAVKKTCQALRDCNRQDRSGYATSVHVPVDVQYFEQLRAQTGMSNKQFAQLAAAKAKKEAEEAVERDAKRSRASLETVSSSTHGNTWGSVSPSVENAAEWLKRQKTNNAGMNFETPMPHATPTTAASTGCMNESSLLDSYHSSSEDRGAAYHTSQHDHSISAHFDVNRASSPVAEPSFTDPFQDEEFHTKPSTSHMGLNYTNSDLDPLHLTARTSAGAGHSYQPAVVDHGAVQGHHSGMQHGHHVAFLHSAGLGQDDFPPPSPIHNDDREISNSHQF